MNPNAPQPIVLKYQLGERILFRHTFQLTVVEHPLGQLLDQPPHSTTSSSSLPKDGDGVLFRGLPMPKHPGRPAIGDRGVLYVPSHYQRHYIDLSGSFGDYLQGFSAKSRSTLKRKVKAFGQFSGGEIRWQLYRKAEEMDVFYRLAREISAITYQERLLDVGLPEGIEFLKNLQIQARGGKVWGAILFHGEKPVSYLHLPIHDGVMLYRHLGFHPDYRRHSPGTVLQYLVLEQLFEKPYEPAIRWFDFTEGEGEHKRFFGNGRIPSGNLFLLKPTFKNAVLTLSHAGLEGLSKWLVGLLERFGIKERVKRFFRR
ncbi:MAG: GNAT family N-acetyltransferase [Magnetococcales bacterium]|nr:GNAT family N-acetyltransferase [Magnetococcales bacterium]